MVRRVTALTVLLAVAPLATAGAQSDDAAKQQHYAAWADAPFTCRDLVDADAGRDSSEDAKGNYDAIISWEYDYPGLADHRDVQNRSRLSDDVVKWCADLAGTGRDRTEKLSSVVEKAWRMIGQ